MKNLLQIIFFFLNIFFSINISAQEYTSDSIQTGLLNDTGEKFEAIFLIIPNADCKIIIDYQERAIIRKNDGLTIGVTIGEHIIEAVRIADNELWQNEIFVNKGQKIIRPLFNLNFNRKSQIIGENSIFVEGGSFVMGCTSNNSSFNKYPLHPVTISDFYISAYEVTNAEYCVFLNENKINCNGSINNLKYILIEKSECNIEFINKIFIPKSGTDNKPVIEITWYGADAYCWWKRGRLPTEAEWEYAAKGGKLGRAYKYAGSNNINEIAWFGENSDKQTHVVGLKEPNELGIYDMSGNVWEWCYDWYDNDFYIKCPQNNPVNNSVSNYKIVRGGSWLNYDLNCRNVSVDKLNPLFSYSYVGFRVCYPMY